MRLSCQSSVAKRLGHTLGLEKEDQGRKSNCPVDIQYCEKKAEQDSHIQFPGFDAGPRLISTERFAPAMLFTWIPVKQILCSKLQLNLRVRIASRHTVKYFSPTFPGDVALAPRQEARDRVAGKVMYPALILD